MADDTLTTRPMTEDDLDAVNAIIERAIMSWSLPDRVKRLSLPLYKYGAIDLNFLTMEVAVSAGRIVGVAAWEMADSGQLPEGRRGLLLHGLFVDPDVQGSGAGTRLLQRCVKAARDQQLDGVLVRAQADAVGFFQRQGMRELPVLEPDRDYAMRYWLAF